MSGDPALVEFLRDKIAKLRTSDGSAYGVMLKSMLQQRGLPNTAVGLQQYLDNYQREAAIKEQEQQALVDRQRREEETRRLNDADERRRNEEWNLVKQQRELELERMRLEVERLRSMNTPTSSQFVDEGLEGFDDFDRDNV